jgi:hypothetical protein
MFNFSAILTNDRRGVLLNKCSMTMCKFMTYTQLSASGSVNNKVRPARMCQLSVVGSPFRFRLIFSFSEGASLTV